MLQTPGLTLTHALPLPAWSATPLMPVVPVRPVGIASSQKATHLRARREQHGHRSRQLRAFRAFSSSSESSSSSSSSSPSATSTPANLALSQDLLPSQYSEQIVRRAAASVVTAGLGFIVVLLTLLSQEEGPSQSAQAMARELGSPIGWVAVAGAILLFGSSGIMFKLPKLVQTPPNPVMFQAFNALGIFLGTTPLLLYQLLHHSLHVDPLGFLGSVDILITSYFAFAAVQRMGYASAPAVWAGVGMLTSFLWGKIGFHEPVESLTQATAAIVLLITGVFQVSRTQEASASGTLGLSDENLEEDGVEGEQKAPGGIAAGPFTLIPAGLSFCLLAGLFDGSLMVPYKLFMQELDAHGLREAAGGASSSVSDTLSYLSSFSLGSAMTVLPLLGLAGLQLRGSESIADDTKREKKGELEKAIDRFAAEVDLVAVPGIVSGLLWAMANFLSVHATAYLGLSLGFPLTQTCIFVNALWGVLLFKEIDLLSDKRRLFQFMFALSSIVAGAALLSKAS